MYTDEELAVHADTTLERVRQMTALRIITPGPEGFARSLAFDPLGEATLKGVAEPVRLFRARTAP